jgi:hypothetical protein
MNVNLHIDRLVLDGVQLAPNQRHFLQASIEAELTRLISQGGVAPAMNQGLAVPKISADHLQLSTGATPAQLGQQIAASVYSGIGNGGKGQ